MKPSITIPLAIAAVVGGATLLQISRKANAVSINPTDTISTVVPTSSPQLANTADATQKTASTYRDGTYSASGAYENPEGQASITVQLIVSHDTITNVTITPKAQDRQTLRYEQEFAQGISSIVVGKPLSSTFEVSRVNGASLTGDGFTKAVTSIRSQAASNT